MTTSVLEEPVGEFQQFSLSPPLLRALNKANYLNPTPIQAQFIPQALTGQDVIGQAQTGTGKTAAFLIPFFNSWRPSKGTQEPSCLVLAPTRELVLQITEEARKISPSNKCRIVPIFGGQKFRRQVDSLQKGCSLAIGTPGRLLDHLKRRTLNTQSLKCVVLDEADRMLDIGFRPDIEAILKKCPRERQTLLLSATLPSGVLRLAHRYMNDPHHINLSPVNLTVDQIRQTYFSVDPDKKLNLLLHVLVREKPRQCIIFCETKRGAEFLFNKLRNKLNVPFAMMHGDLPQAKRNRVMKQFREGQLRMVIATDVIGRGIDVANISHIINFDLPRDSESYVHRIGRTGRMGADGVAISFVTPEEGKELTAIEVTINTLIREDQIPGFQAVTMMEKPEEETPKTPSPIFGQKTKRYSRRL